LITLLQSGVSLLSNSWLVYVGVLFIAMVIFAPTGLAGIIQAHGPIRRSGRLGRLLVPYLRLVIPSLALVLGFVGFVELMSFLTIGAAQGKKLVLFGGPIDVRAAMPWMISAGCLIVGAIWLRVEAAGFHRIWDDLTAELKTRR
jgi:branched-chain amino acid transport system permease protein